MKKLSFDKPLYILAPLAGYTDLPFRSVVKKFGADLIFIGSHGKGSSVPLFFGSVARKVVELSSIPVVVVPVLEDSNIAFAEI